MPTLGERFDAAGKFLWLLYTDWRYWALLLGTAAFSYWIVWALPWLPEWVSGIISFVISVVLTVWLIADVEKKRRKREDT